MKQGWEIKKLGEVCEIKTGKKDVNQGNPDGNYPFFTCAREHTFSDTFSFDTEALLIAGNGDVGNVSYYKGKFEAYQRTYVLFDFKGIQPRFLFRVLDGTLKQVMAQSKLGNTMPYIKLGMLKEFEIPLPPLPEQQHIVSILDEAFAAIAKAKANAEQNLKNAKELFESYLQGVFENKNWETNTLGEIGSPKMCKRILKHQTSTTGEIPFYKIGTFGKIPDAFISKEIYDEFRTKYSFPKKGDVLISASGTIGRRVRYDGEPAFFQDSNIVWIDNDEKHVLNDYLYVFYEFCDWQPSKGATISRLYNSNLTSIKIVFPKSLEEQKNILLKIDAVSSETKKLESIYQQKINDLEELKKSILQKAFAGELKTSQEVV